MLKSKKDQQVAEQGKNVDFRENDTVTYAKFTSTDGCQDNPRYIFTIMAVSEAF